MSKAKLIRQSAEARANGTALGEFVSWSMTSITIGTDALQAALDSAGLGSLKVPSRSVQRCFDGAWGSPAVKEAVGDGDVGATQVEGAEDGTMVMQIDRVVEATHDGRSGVDHEYTAFWSVNLTTGEITPYKGRESALARITQRELKRRLTQRNAHDITALIDRAYSKLKADLFRLRRLGGAYFIPACHSGVTDKVETFVRAVAAAAGRPVAASMDEGGVAFIRLPIADAAGSRKTVGQVIEESVGADIAALNAEIQAFTAETKPSVLERRAVALKDLLAKCDAYQTLLGPKASTSLTRAIEAARSALASKVAAANRRAVKVKRKGAA